MDGVVTAYGHVTFARDAFAAIIRGRKVDVDVSAADDDIGVTLDGGAVRRIVVSDDSSAARGDVDVAIGDGDGAVRFDAFRYTSRVVEDEGSAVDSQFFISFDAVRVGTRKCDIYFSSIDDQGAVG